ncbi:MAG TPA: hypothetical protein PLD47_01860 [Aggregatilineales bacterium]|nr:hypothetical protein [Anaerolineales bacterium]HRE46444.1 hypothetical protein [Aggregatilineales bacterium]
MPLLTSLDNSRLNYTAATWTLTQAHEGRTILLVQGDPSGLQCDADFARARRLPSALSPDGVQMVVTGYAAEDNTWHVGIILTPPLAAERGGRWCGLAVWAAADSAAARDAGESLAGILQRPFRYVPPQPTVPDVADEDEPDEDDQPAREAPPPPPLLPLPIDLSGEYVLALDPPQTLILRRPSAWRRGGIIRTVVLALLVPVFAYLSLGAVTSIFAPVQPEWLPYVGVLITLILVVLAVRQGAEVFRDVHVSVDGRAGLLRRQTRGRRILAQSPFEGIDYLLLSQTINRRQNTDDERGSGALRFSAEVWLHAYSSRRGFIPLCQVSDSPGLMAHAAAEREDRRILDLREIATPAHHAAAHLAALMNVPVYLETR